MTLFPNSIAWELFTTIASDAVLVSSSVTVQLHEVVNSDPQLTPWVGIYRQEIPIEPLRIRPDLPWTGTVKLQVLAQAYSLESRRDAMDRLDRLITRVLSAVDSNRTLGNTIDRITGYSVDPFGRALGDDEDWFVTDLITINAEVSL